MTGGNGGGRCVFYVDDQILDLNEVISVNNSSIRLPNDFVINGRFFFV